MSLSLSTSRPTVCTTSFIMCHSKSILSDYCINSHDMVIGLNKWSSSIVDYQGTREFLVVSYTHIVLAVAGCPLTMELSGLL